MTRPPDEAPPPPAGNELEHDPSALAVGGIYIKWEGRLWQEQPDGSYLLWNGATRAWERSSRQPPHEHGTVATKECPSCGRRIKASFRSCPYCGHGFAVMAHPALAADTTKRRRRRSRSREITVPAPVTLGVVSLALILAVFGFVTYRQNRACANWHSAMRAVTLVSVRVENETEAQPRSYEELLELNEELYEAQRPEGCE